MAETISPYYVCEKKRRKKMRMIDADKVVEEIKVAQEVLRTSDDKQWERNKKYFKGLAWAHKIVLEQPTIEAEERIEVLEKALNKACEVLASMTMDIEATETWWKEWALKNG